MSDLQKKLAISLTRVEEVNAFLLDPHNKLVNDLLALVERYGGPEEINRKASEARKLENLLGRLEDQDSPYLTDVRWLMEMRDTRRFITIPEYRRRVMRKDVSDADINMKNAVTLEISALQFFPWLRDQAERAIEKGQLMPGRFIRVRNMAEQTEDNGDTLAVAAAMQIVGASYVETMDTKGTDGSNVHLGGPETITGYFGGVGEPNDYPLKWADEYLKYYTTYGIRQVLNVNPGTVLVGYMLHKLGIDNQFKISVYMGNDNPFAALWTLIGARLFSRDDGSTSLIGFNFSNSVNNTTIRDSDVIRRALSLTENVRFEHHITETYKSIVRQPYNRRDELVEVAAKVPNISAKHEGADPEIDKEREHPSDILEYFLTKNEILDKGLMEKLRDNYLDKHEALNKTADALTKAGIGVIAAENLHKAT